MAKAQVGARRIGAGSRKRVAAVLAVASAIVGGAAAWLLLAWLGAVRNPPEDREPRVPMVVAARELLPGRPIQTDDVALAFVPSRALPRVVGDDGVARLAAVFPSREAVVGQIPRERILPREAVRRERLVDAHAGVGLSAVLPSGTRAVSLDLGGADALTGFLDPGTYVDVLASGRGEDRRPMTRTVLEVIPVLAVNGHADGFEAGAPQRAATVTLQLFPEQVERLALADSEGEITLILRGSGDLVATRAALPPRLVAPVLPPRVRESFKPRGAEPIAHDYVVRVRGTQVDHILIEPSEDTDGR